MLVGRRFVFWNGPFSGGNCHLGVGPLDSHDTSMSHPNFRIQKSAGQKHLSQHPGNPTRQICQTFTHWWDFWCFWCSIFDGTPDHVFKTNKHPWKLPAGTAKNTPFFQGRNIRKNPTVLSSSRSFSGMFYQVSNSFNLDNFVKPRTNLAMNKIDERIRGEWKLTHDGSMVAWYIYPLIHHKNQPFMEVNIPWIHMDPIGSTTFSTWRRLLGFALKWWDLIVITPMGSQSVKNHLKHIQVLRYVLLRSRWKWGKLKTQKI